MSHKPRRFSIFKSNPTTRRGRKSNNTTYSKLEFRNLLATLAFNPTNGILSIKGTADADVISITQSQNTISVVVDGAGAEDFDSTTINQLLFTGEAGDDSITNDSDIRLVALAGPGNDTITGGSANDVLIGQLGNDTINGGAGDDILGGNDGDDVLSGNEGNDDLRGGIGADILDGGIGNDVLRGAAGEDTIEGGEGDDRINGGAGADQISDVAGDDSVLAGAGDDVVDTGVGNDFVFGDTGADVVNGGDGNDTIVGGADDDTINGGAGNDRLFGTGGFDTIRGGDGDDVIGGNSGNDSLFGELGNDRIAGGSGNDTISGGDGEDNLFGERGDDTINGGGDRDRIFGSFGLDTISGDAGDDVIAGGEDNDTISGGLGSDLIFAGQGDDTVSGDGGSDFIYGQAGNDFLRGGDAIDIIRGSEGDDILHGDAGNDRLFGENGDDRLFGEAGIDRLFGGNGSDALVGGTGEANRLSGGEDGGRDRFVVAADDLVFDRLGGDALLRFVNGSSEWTDLEIEVIDDGLDRLVKATGNTRLLTDPLSGQPLVFVKENTIPQGTSLATNTLVEVEDFIFNPATGRLEATPRLERRISFADWPEGVGNVSNLRTLEVPRTIALGWASREAISSVLPTQTSLWNQFLRLSDWLEEAPTNNPELYSVSGDGQWFYRKDSQFAVDTQDDIADRNDLDARLNPQQDFASTWQLFFTPGEEAEKQRLSVKLEKIGDLFSMLSII